MLQAGSLARHRDSAGGYTLAWTERHQQTRAPGAGAAMTVGKFQHADVLRRFVDVGGRAARLVGTHELAMPEPVPGVSMADAIGLHKAAAVTTNALCPVRI